MVDISQPPTGRLLLEKRSEPVALLAPSIGAFVALLFSISYLFIEPGRNMSRVESILMGIVLFFGSVALLFATYVIWKTRILVFEKCLGKLTPIRNIFLYYDEVEAISYSITRKSITRVYLGTQYFFNLYAQQKTIEFSITLEEENDQELKVLLAYISENIANRLLHQLEKDGTALWVKDLRFAQEGLEYLYMYDWEPLPYNQIGECEIDGGIFYLRSTKSDLPVFRINTITPNFFPGLIALRKKCTPEPPPKPWVFPGENN